MFCPKCGKEIADDAAFCPGCGAVLSAKSGQSAAKTDVKAGLKNTKNRILIIAVLGVIAILLALMSLNSLSGDNKRACDLIISVSGEFSSPSELKLVSGSFSEKKNLFYCVLEYCGSKNKYVILDSDSGSPSIFDADLWAEVSADSLGYSKSTILAAYWNEFNSTDLDIIRINQVLERKLKKK